MKVRATALGYYGDMRRKEGTVFDLVVRTVGDKEKRRTLTEEQQFSKVWMEKIDEDGNVIENKSTPKDNPAAQAEPDRAMDRPLVSEPKHEKSHAPSKSHPQKRK